MLLSEIVSEDRILVPLEAETLEEAVGLLFHQLEAAHVLDERAAPRLAAEFLSGVRGEVVRVNEFSVLLAAQTNQVETLVGALGSAPSAFDLGERGEGGTASILLLLLTPRRVSPLKIQAIPALTRYFRDRDNVEKIRAAGSRREILALPDFMNLEVQEQLLVADGLSPLEYRVYPDMPLEEVVGLMVRQGIGEVPVVGEKLEFLGLITSADAIKYLVPERLTGSEGARGGKKLLAREVMTRSVMCIPDDQSLVEAANLMVNKGVNQVPVVRSGELVGFLSAETALRLLYRPFNGE